MIQIKFRRFSTIVLDSDSCTWLRYHTIEHYCEHTGSAITSLIFFKAPSLYLTLPPFDQWCSQYSSVKSSCWWLMSKLKIPNLYDVHDEHANVGLLMQKSTLLHIKCAHVTLLMSMLCCVIPPLSLCVLTPLWTLFQMWWMEIVQMKYDSEYGYCARTVQNIQNSRNIILHFWNHKCDVKTNILLSASLFFYLFF